MCTMYSFPRLFPMRNNLPSGSRTCTSKLVFACAARDLDPSSTTPPTYPHSPATSSTRNTGLRPSSTISTRPEVIASSSSPMKRSVAPNYGLVLTVNHYTIARYVSIYNLTLFSRKWCTVCSSNVIITRVVMNMWSNEHVW